MDPNGTQITGTPNGTRMGPQTRHPNGSQGPWTLDIPKLGQGHAQLGPGTCPTWTRDTPNLDLGHAQPGSGTCPTWTWDMPNLDLGLQEMPNLDIGHAEPGTWICSLWTLDMLNLDQGHAHLGSCIGLRERILTFCTNSIFLIIILFTKWQQIKISHNQSVLPKMSTRSEIVAKHVLFHQISAFWLLLGPIRLYFRLGANRAT